jgi:hypothetical protein
MFSRLRALAGFRLLQVRGGGLGDFVSFVDFGAQVVGNILHSDAIKIVFPASAGEEILELRLVANPGGDTFARDALLSGQCSSVMADGLAVPFEADNDLMSLYMIAISSGGDAANGVVPYTADGSTIFNNMLRMDEPLSDSVKRFVVTLSRSGEQAIGTILLLGDG